MRAPSPRRRFPGLGGFNFGAFFLTTKLFDTVNTYNVAAISPAAAEFVSVDLATIGGSAVVTMPVTAVIGQCIGVVPSSEFAGADISFVGPAAPALRFVGESALFTWSGAAWLPVSYVLLDLLYTAFGEISGDTTSSATYVPLLTDGIGAPPAGSFLQIDASLNVEVVTASTVYAQLLVDGAFVREVSIGLSPGGRGMLTFSERVPIATDSTPVDVAIEWHVGSALETATNLATTLRTIVTVV